MQVKHRKIQDHLVISGLAVIAFGLWSVIKSAVFFTLNKGMSNYLDEAAVPDELRGTISVMTAVILIVVFSIDIGLRLLVGLNARAEGRGIKRGAGYIVIAILLAVVSVFSFVIFMVTAVRLAETVDTVLTAVVELTSLGALILLIITALINRKFMKASEAERE